MVTKTKQRLSPSDIAFRKSFEALNIGVVPSNPDQLFHLSIGCEEFQDDIRKLLAYAPINGASRILMGYYGSGKSHHLKLVRAISLQEGWVTATIELDPMSADPAKPHTIYHQIIANLEFPELRDRSKNGDFFDLVKEIRKNMSKVRQLNYVKSSKWFCKALDILKPLSHRRDDIEYVSAVNWLGGQVQLISGIKAAARRNGFSEKIPIMPRIRESGLVYVFHLVVLNQILRCLGYQGLALIIDEAEHVRTYSHNRYYKAKNFFDALSRCAHKPQFERIDPFCDHDLGRVSPFWQEGPHYAMFVGLTAGEDIGVVGSDSDDLGVLAHNKDEIIQLETPNLEEYKVWVEKFLEQATKHLGPKVQLLSNPNITKKISNILYDKFDSIPKSDRVLRNWTKLASFPVSVLLSKPYKISESDLIKKVESAATKISGEELPWDEF